MNEKLKRFFSIANRIQQGLDVEDSDLEFYFSYAPEIDQEKIDKFLSSKDGEGLSQQDVNAALLESSRQLQASPEYKERLLNIALDKKSGELTDKIAQGANLLLGASDIAQSLSQISASKSALSKSKRPSRPIVPGRDLYLQQALRGAEEGTMNAARALAPAEAQIQDQYQADLANAKTASTGQAGAFGAYAQTASNRRNRAAQALVPLADEVKAREQARYDNLLGMRQQETQNMFQNQASLYPYDLQQYNADQQAAASLGSTGRENLRNSLYNFAGNLAPAIGKMYKERRYRNYRNQAQTAGLDPDLVESVNRKLDAYSQDDYNMQDGYGDYYNQTRF
jgi:hypothetical protein